MFKKFLAVAALAAIAAPAFAADNCKVSIDGNDKMQYVLPNNAKELTIPKACKEFTIDLKHSGKMPIVAMGHNIIIAKKSDVNSVSNAFTKLSRDAKDFTPDNPKFPAAEKAKIVAHTALIGAGQTTSVKLSAKQIAELAKGGYEGFCSFPGHHMTMKFDIVVK